MTTDREPFDVATTEHVAQSIARCEWAGPFQPTKPWEDRSEGEREKFRWIAKAAQRALSERLTTPTDHAGLVAEARYLGANFELEGDTRAARFCAEAAAALQAPVPAGVADFVKHCRRLAAVDDGAMDRHDIAVLQRQLERAADRLEQQTQFLLAIFGATEQAEAENERLARTNEALTREHAARVAKVRAEIEREGVGFEGNRYYAGLMGALAIIDAEFPPAGQAEGETQAGAIDGTRS